MRSRHHIDPLRFGSAWGENFEKVFVLGTLIGVQERFITLVIGFETRALARFGSMRLGSIGRVR